MFHTLIGKFHRLVGNRRGRQAIARAVRDVSLLEPMEARRLMSITLDGNGKLAVVVEAADENIQVYINNQNKIQVWGSTGQNWTQSSQDVVQSILNVGGELKNGLDVSDAIFIPCTITGGGGDDTIHGSSYNDSITTGDGNDLVWAGEGNDIISGGDGNDQLEGMGDDDDIYGGNGNDYLGSGGGDDELYGGDGDDDLYAAAGGDSLYGEGGDDEVFMQDGDADDYADGGAGYDILVNYDSYSVLISETGGSDGYGGYGYPLYQTYSDGYANFEY